MFQLIPVTLLFLMFPGALRIGRFAVAGMNRCLWKFRLTTVSRLQGVQHRNFLADKVDIASAGKLFA